MNVSPDTRFDEATPDQFCAYWEAQGWTVLFGGSHRLSRRNAQHGPPIIVAHEQYPATSYGRLALGDVEDKRPIIYCFPHPIATFGEALRLANNLAQAELFGGWAE